MAERTLFWTYISQSSAPSSVPGRNRSVTTESETHRPGMTDHRIPEPGPKVHGMPEIRDPELKSTGPQSLSASLNLRNLSCCPYLRELPEGQTDLQRAQITQQTQDLPLGMVCSPPMRVEMQTDMRGMRWVGDRYKPRE